MKEQALTEASSEFAKMLAVGKAKEGKTVALAANLLGVLPWQKYGGVIDDPANLHILAFDSGAVVGLKEFLRDLCGMKEADIARVRIYNFQEDVRKISLSDDEWDYSFYNSVVTTGKKIQDRIKSNTSSAVMISSLTTLALTLERAIAGPPGNEDKRGAGMDQSKWSDFARQLNEIRNLLQQDSWHCIWEGHVYQPPPTGQDKSVIAKETIQVSGKAGYNFPNNVEQVVRIRRSFGETYERTKVDRVYFDTRPTMDFVAGGRLFTTNLDAKEFDLTYAFHKLELKIGRWGRPKKSKEK
jgi:hypothetical protein